MTLAPSTQFDALAVPLGLLRRYLLANHWRRIDAPRPPPLPAHLQKMAASFMGGRVGGERNFDLYVLSAPDQQDIELVVPRRIDDVDFRMRMESVLETLCALTGLDQGAMITEIRAIGFDLVQSKIPSNLVLDDSVQLEIAASYIDNIRELLAATATTELDPTPFYPRAVPAATKYADACRFGHTFRGSFGFTIESPIDEKPPQLTLEIGENPPFERRVIQRLARGVVATCRAVDTGDIRPLVESVSTGFGANACERFAKLIEDTSPGGLTMSFSFSPEWKADPEIAAASEYVVDRRHIEVSRSAAKTMREEPAARPEVIVGGISDLHSDDPENLMDSKSGRRITVRWFNGTREVNVLIPLSPADYKVASDAHITGRQIRVSGTLSQERRSLTLRDAKDLTAIEPPP
jgi:hypothetical protein